MGQIVWKKGDPRHGRQESSNEAVKRLQSDLGCYFVGGWHAYVKHHAKGKSYYCDPLKQNPEFTARFLSHLMDSGGDIRTAMRDDNIKVDWWEVERVGKKGKGYSKGSGSDTKGTGKRPAPIEDQPRASRQRRS